MLLSFVDRLGSDPTFASRIDGLKRDLLARPELGDLAHNICRIRDRHRAQASGETQVLQQHLAGMFCEGGRGAAGDASCAARSTRAWSPCSEFHRGSEERGSTFIADQVKGLGHGAAIR